MENRPGLSAIAYRAGTFGSFRQAMLEAIATTPDLVAWTARRPDDFGITSLEMWAYLADILTFYQERTANEAYLRTAVQRDSLMRLAALLDYKPDPGSAATTYLAFTVDQAATVPSGLRVQSVPGPGELPQKYETTAAIDAMPAWSRFRAYPDLGAYSPLGTGSTIGTLLNADDAPLAPGDKLVMYDTQKAEDKKVEAVTSVDWRTEVRWSPALSATRQTAYKWVRKFRLFGANAPGKYLAPKLVDSEMTFVESTVSFALASSTTIYLDNLYDDLKVGTQLLVVNLKDNGVSSRTVNGVSQSQQAITGSGAQVPVLQATVTEVTLSGSGISATDLRSVVVYELSGAPLELWNRQYPSTGLSGEYLSIPESTLSGESLTEFLPKGHTILVDDGQRTPALLTVVEVTQPSTYGNVPHLRVQVTPSIAPESHFDGTTSYGMANIAPATHGETVKPEVLGSGDPTTTFQSFTLKKSPLTYVPDPTADGGAAPTLGVRVGGVLWDEVDSFYGQAPTNRVYTTAQQSDGTTVIRFGDGITGARPPRGSGNIQGTYRQGLGEAGQVRAATLTNAMDKFVGLKAVTNPMAASGGVDAEDETVLRADAPTTVRTFGRAVSLRDFVDLARSVTGVKMAVATWVWSGRHRLVHLTVAGADGEAITGDPHQTLVAYLDARRDPNQPLRVDTYTPVYIQVEAGVEVDPAYESETVTLAAQQALLDHFTFGQREFGQWVHVSDLYAVLAGVDGVKAAYLRKLRYRDNDAYATGDLYKTADVWGAHDRNSTVQAQNLSILYSRLTGGQVRAAELALVKASTDVVVVEGGIA